MARRKKKSSRRRSRTVYAAPKKSKRAMAVIRDQPLAVKGGIAVTGLNLLSDAQLVYQVQNKQWSNALGTFKTRAMTPNTYVPIVVGLLVHKGAKILGVKGI